MSKVRFTSLINAGYAKYAINTFLATKVIFFNELKNMYSEEAFDELTDLISLDDRIGNSHMMVPGPDQKYGFGGKCFPKDTSAFAVSARRIGSPLKLLEKAIDINKELRDEIKK
jgi:UDPglucose 6-dehydrogenase